MVVVVVGLLSVLVLLVVVCCWFPPIVVGCFCFVSDKVAVMMEGPAFNNVTCQVWIKVSHKVSLIFGTCVLNI